MCDSQQVSPITLSRREGGWYHKEKEMGIELMKSSSTSYWGGEWPTALPLSSVTMEKLTVLVSDKVWSP